MNDVTLNHIAGGRRGFAEEPCRKGEAEAMAGTQTLSDMEFFDPTRREKIRALLIDDDADDRDLIARLAARSNQLEIELIACRSVEEAQALAHQPFDVVFVDYWLGSDTSIGFIHDFARAHDVPCVLVTGLDVPDVRRVAFRAGVEAYLSKEGMSTQALESVILSVMNRHAKL
jgi:DNA-binding NarL/FixJ family response regulator